MCSLLAVLHLARLEARFTLSLPFWSRAAWRGFLSTKRSSIPRGSTFQESDPGTYPVPGADTIRYPTTRSSHSRSPVDQGRGRQAQCKWRSITPSLACFRDSADVIDLQAFVVGDLGLIDLQGLDAPARIFHAVSEHSSPCTLPSQTPTNAMQC